MHDSDHLHKNNSANIRQAHNWQDTNVVSFTNNVAEWALLHNSIMLVGILTT